jgi:hypothetical protein
MAAEHHEPEAPAHPSDKNPERKQQSARADNPKNVCRGHPQRPADDIALLAARGEGQRGEARQAQHKGEEMSHLAPSLEATVIGASRFVMRPT